MLIDTKLIKSAYEQPLQYTGESYIPVPGAVLEFKDVSIQRDLRVYGQGWKGAYPPEFLVHGQHTPKPIEALSDEYPEEVFFLGGNANFGHMLFEYLLRIYAYDKLGYEGMSVCLWDDCWRYADWLMMYPKIGPVLSMTPRTFKHVHVPSQMLGRFTQKVDLPSGQSGMISMVYAHPEAVRWTRDNASCLAAKQTRRIYAVRKGAHRNVLNDEEVQKTVKELGFEVVDLTAYGLCEQVNIVSSCEHILFLIGAGGCLSLFAKGKVSQLTLPPTHIDGPFSTRAFSRLLGNPWNSLEGVPEGQGRDSNYIIDTEKLKGLVG